MEGDAKVLEQRAKHVLHEASVGPSSTNRLQRWLSCTEPGVEFLELGHADIGVEIGDFVLVRRHICEKFCPESFHQVVHQEWDAEAARKAVQSEVEAVLIGVLRQTFAGHPRYEACECVGSLVWPMEDALARTVRGIAAEVPEATAVPHCQSTVQTKRLHALAADGDCELYTVRSVAGFCQNLVFRVFRTWLTSEQPGLSWVGVRIVDSMARLWSPKVPDPCVC